MKNGKRNLEEHRRRAADEVAKLSFEQKLTAFAGTAAEMEQIGLPRFWVGGEAAHGIQARNDQAGELGVPAYTTVFPNPIGMTATWDKELMHRIGQAVGIEARSLFIAGKHGSLAPYAPTIDMERDPRWGRNEEGYGEDPHLASRMGGEYILGMAGDDENYVRCGATIKHFYGNNVEKDRTTADSNIPPELDESYYLRVFKETIDYAHPIAVMSSYNLVNSVASTVNPILREKLKKWGISYVVADAGALIHTVDPQHVAKDVAEGAAMAVKAGVDYFPDAVAGDNSLQRNAIREAIDRGLMTEADLDRSLTDKLTAYSLLGLFPYDEKYSLPKAPFEKEDYDLSRVDCSEHRQLARLAASKACVLLKNDKDALPINNEESVALLGPFADRNPLDWYSGYTTHMVTLREGMESQQPKVSVCDDLMPRVRIKTGGGYACIKNGMLSAGTVKEAEVFSIMLWDESRITLRTGSTGKLLTTSRPDGFEEKDDIRIQDAPTVFAYPDESFSWFVNEAFEMYDSDGNVIYFDEDNAESFWENADIKGIKNRDGSLELSFETVESLDSRAGSLKAADKAVVCLGLHPMINCKENIDRRSIELPPFQRAMLSHVMKRYDKVILLLSCGGPVAVTKEQNDDRIRAIMWAAQGSEEYGNGVADILCGKLSPAGRLPQTWYASDDDLGDINDYDIKSAGKTYLYLKCRPLYPFGYGLSYTGFEYELRQKPDGIYVYVKNTGDTISDTVVQVYRSPDGKLYIYGQDMPKESCLAGFERVKDVAPGQKVEVFVEI